MNLIYSSNLSFHNPLTITISDVAFIYVSENNYIFILVV